MVDTPVAVISREPERVKVSLVLVPIQHCLCTYLMVLFAFKMYSLSIIGIYKIMSDEMSVAK